MKKEKKLLTPRMEFIRFSTADVITTSGGSNPPTSQTPMTAGSQDTATGFKIGLDFGNPLQ